MTIAYARISINVKDAPRNSRHGANKGFCSVVKYHGSTLHFVPFSQRWVEIQGCGFFPRVHKAFLHTPLPKVTVNLTWIYVQEVDLSQDFATLWIRQFHSLYRISSYKHPMKDMFSTWGRSESSDYSEQWIFSELHKIKPLATFKCTQVSVFVRHQKNVLICPVPTRGGWLKCYINLL